MSTATARFWHFLQDEQVIPGVEKGPGYEKQTAKKTPFLPRNEDKELLLLLFISFLLRIVRVVIWYKKFMKIAIRERKEGSGISHSK